MNEIDHRLSQFFDALSNGVRLQISKLLLEEKSMYVKDIAGTLDRSQQSISRQLKVLRHHDLVSSKTQSAHRYYSLKRPDLIARAMEFKNLLQRTQGN
jgi:DNA-binding transcriptional ArsR family regulator